MAGFKSGKTNTVYWNNGGNTSYLKLAAFRHSVAFEDEGVNVTSSVHDGVDAWVSSILKGSGTASFHIHDDDAGGYPSDAGIKAQANGAIKIEFGAGRQTIIPVYINRVEHMNETAGGTDYTVSFKLNGEVSRLNPQVSLQYPS